MTVPAHRPMRAIVVGAGIGGLSAAVALRRAGIETEVYERATTLAGIQAGGGLVLWHNAVLALRRLGLADEVAAIGHELHRHEFRSWRGRQLADWPVAAVSRRVGAPAYAVSRPALHRALADAAGGDIRLGVRCVGLEPDDDGVSVRFDGGEARADLVVGADGLRSTVRRLLRPFEPPPRFAGYTAWQGVVRLADARVPDGTFENVWGRGRRFICFRIDDDGLVYWDGVTSDQIGHELDMVGHTRQEIVRAQFAGWPDPIPALIDATAEDDIAAIDIFDRRPVGRWGIGRVTLLGDAAHPMTFNLGQGACQAIEDALVLADCLARKPGGGDMPAALLAYERRRRARTTKMVETSWTIGAVGRWRGRAACAFRAAFMRAAFNRVIFRQNWQLMMDVDF